MSHYDKVESLLSASVDLQQRLDTLASLKPMLGIPGKRTVTIVGSLVEVKTSW